MLEVRDILVGEHNFPCVKIDSCILRDLDEYFIEKTPYTILRYGEHWLTLKDYLDIVCETHCLDCDYYQIGWKADTQEVEILLEGDVNLYILNMIYEAFDVSRGEKCIKVCEDKIQVLFKQTLKV